MRDPSDVFVSKVLRKLHQEKVPISTKAKGKIISFVKKFYGNVCKTAKDSSKGIIGSKVLKDALQQEMRKDQASEVVRVIHNMSRYH